VLDLAVAPDGRVVTGDQDGVVFVRDLTDPDRPPVPLRGQKGAVGVLTISPEGRLAAGSEVGVVRVWDLAHPDDDPLVLQHGPQPVEDTPVTALSFAPGGQLAVGHENGAVRIWELTQHDGLLATFKGGPVTSLAFGPRGRIIVGDQNGGISVWDSARPTEEPVMLTDFKKDNAVLILTTTGDERLISAGVDETVRIWEFNYNRLLDLAIRKAGRDFRDEELLRFFPGQDARNIDAEPPR
jgi:WD40 repeat protein